MTAEETKTIREWLVAEYLKRKDDQGYRLAERELDVPEDYGNYSLYIGMCGFAFGMSPNLRKSFQEFEYRLKESALAIFLWRPDSDGSVKKSLDGPHDDDLSECTRCSGSGQVECLACDGTGDA